MLTTPHSGRKFWRSFSTIFFFQLKILHFGAPNVANLNRFTCQFYVRNRFWKNNDGDGDGGTGGAGRAGGGAGGMVGEAKTTGMPGQGQASGDAKDANKKEPWTPPSAWPQGKPAKQKDKSRDKSGETGFV